MAKTRVNTGAPHSKLQENWESIKKRIMANKAGKKKEPDELEAKTKQKPAPSHPASASETVAPVADAAPTQANVEPLVPPNPALHANDSPLSAQPPQPLPKSQSAALAASVASNPKLPGLPDTTATFLSQPNILLNSLKEKASNFMAPKFYTAGVQLEKQKKGGNQDSLALATTFQERVRDLNTALQDLIKDLSDDLAKQQTGKTEPEIDKNSASLVCQHTLNLINTLASEDITYEDKLKAIVDYKKACIKSSPGFAVLKAVGAVAVAAVTFTFVAACAIAIGISLSLIALPAAPTVLAGVFAGIAMAANWAIGILTTSGVLGLAAGAGTAYGLFSASERERSILDVANTAHRFLTTEKKLETLEKQKKVGEVSQVSPRGLGA